MQFVKSSINHMHILQATKIWAIATMRSCLAHTRNDKITHSCCYVEVCSFTIMANRGLRKITLHMAQYWLCTSNLLPTPLLQVVRLP